MSGKMPAAYFREYRARRRLAGNPVRRRPSYVRPPRNYAAEYARSLDLHPSVVATPRLPILMPELQHGVRVAFWEDELKLDLVQEGRLAELEGRDPAAAVAAYRVRETNWRAHIVPLTVAA